MTAASDDADAAAVCLLACLHFCLLVCLLARLLAGGSFGLIC